ncbi:MAG TPA: dentin sialophosphoprotein, partial [Marinobacter sp.]|nr:dentin sialophosphoprotein [Marinobacter sp.]
NSTNDSGNSQANNSTNDSNKDQSNSSTNDSNKDLSNNSTNDSNKDLSNNSTNDSNNNQANNSTNDSNKDQSDSSTNGSYNDQSDSSIAGSYNDSSDNSSSMLTMSVDMFLNSAELDGSVSDVSVTYGDATGRRSYNEVRTSNSIGDGSANFTGVGAFAQNVGVGSVTQANVSVMSNLSAGGGGTQ